MISIPGDLLAKLQQKLQTSGLNADPRVYIIVHRTERFIGFGDILNPKTIDKEPPATDLGSWDLAISRPPELYKTYPDYIYRIQVDDGQAEVTRTPYDSMMEALPKDPEEEHMIFEWEDLDWTVADAQEVAIEFNGHWVRAAKDAVICFDQMANWTFVSDGEPWIFWTDTSGALWTQQGQGGTPLQLASDGVTKISAIRGWKNVYRWNHDHGLIIAYIKNNAVYYRTFANQGTEETPLPPAWESEREVTELPTPAQNVAVCRTNDYRTCFLCESEGEIHWAITDRNWAGMAIRDHRITARAAELDIDFIAIDYRDGHTEHTITATADDLSCKLCPPIWPEVADIYNPEIEEEFAVDVICIELTLDIYGDGEGLEDAFTVKDEIDNEYDVLATSKASDKVLSLSTENFEGAYGDLTVTYAFNTAPIYSQVEGGCYMELDDFSISFTPTLAPPEGYTEHTITATADDLSAEFKLVIYHDGHTEHTITAEATELFIDFMHVDDIPP